MNKTVKCSFPHILIESGNSFIIASGAVLSFDENADCKISFALDKNFSYSICLSFLDEPSSSLTSIRKETLIAQNQTNIICINFHDLVGTSTSKPFHICSYQGKDILFNFWITASPGNGIRKIIYSLYWVK